jgi:hypothetical protein
MNRRTFLAVSGAAGLAPLGRAAGAGQAAPAARDYYLLQQFHVENEDQKRRFDAYLKDAAIPALNRLGICPVGVFVPRTGLSPVYVLLRHKSPKALLGMVDKLLCDPQYARSAADVLGATAAHAGFQRLESSLLLAFRGMPRLQMPVHGPGRVFQLRIYESPSVATARKKIEMFNDAGELDIFRRVGLSAVFFGETLVGAKMPNLTYMLAFESPQEQDAAWKRFLADPGWLKLRTRQEYADKTILCGITNLLLKPAPYSQI